MILRRWAPGMHCTTHLNWDLHCEKARAVSTPCQGHTTHGEQPAPKATFSSANGHCGRFRQYPAVSWKSWYGLRAGFQHLISLKRFLNAAGSPPFLLKRGTAVEHLPEPKLPSKGNTKQYFWLYTFSSHFFFL